MHKTQLPELPFFSLQLHRQIHRKGLHNHYKKGERNASSFASTSIGFWKTLLCGWESRTTRCNPMPYFTIHLTAHPSPHASGQWCPTIRSSPKARVVFNTKANWLKKNLSLFWRFLHVVGKCLDSLICRYPFWPPNKGFATRCFLKPCLNTLQNWMFCNLVSAEPLKPDNMK